MRSQNFKIGAYVLAADPWWVENSILSYYDRVEHIVVSYDTDHISWTGTPIPVEECLDRIRAIDVQGKCRFEPGHYARLNHAPLDNDTYQRRAALEVASVGVDWVLQLDTDEVIPNADIFFDCLAEADQRMASAMEYPSRHLYARTARGRFLESSTRLWRPRSSYPAPLAVRSGSELTLCRQVDTPSFRVDISPHNTEPRRPFDETVHRVVDLEDCVLHYSWIRDDEYMQRKAGWSGHSDVYQEPVWLKRWRRRRDHPLLALAATPFQADDGRFRLVRLTTEQEHRIDRRSTAREPRHAHDVG